MTTWGSWFSDQFGGGADEDENDDEASGFSGFKFAQRDGLIFLIDCTKSMFEKDGEKSNFQQCIKCCQNVMQDKIIGSETDLLGVVFFGTRESKNASNFKNIYVLQQFGQPGAEQVLQLEALQNDNSVDFDNTYGHSNDFCLSDALWMCLNLFSNCSKKLGSKRVMLFTCNDDPHAGNQQLKRQAMTKATDLYETGVELELMHMHSSGEKFDVTRFYKDLLYYNDSDLAALPDPSDRFEELLRRTRAKDHKRRAMTRIPFTLGTGIDMAVGVFNLVRSTPKPPFVKLYKKTNEELKTITRFSNNDGDVLMPHDVKKAQDWAGRTIAFEQEELAQIKKFDATGLVLLGFKPRSSLKRYYHVKPAQFMYPEESLVKGSTTLFTALLKKCLDREVTPICRYIPRNNATPRMVALLPQEEELDEDNFQVTPPGFHVIFLPFADDFRKLNFAETPKADEEQIDKAKEIIKKLKFPFASEQFQNPNLQNYYRNLEALALDRDAPEQMVDLTVPDNDHIEKRAGALIADFKQSVGLTGQKRKTAGAGDASAAKKAKATEELDMKKEAEAGRVAKLTVPVLKEFAKQANIKCGTKKAELVAAVNDYFGVSLN